MPASIRGHQGEFKIFENGGEVKIATITSLTINQDSNFSRSFYVGNAVGEGDQTIDGFSGSFEMEVKDNRIGEFLDALITNNLNGIGVSDYSFIETERYPDGTSASYVHFDCQFSLSKNQSGQNEKMRKTVNFQSAGRVKI
jgi:hypothetical protein